jgi:acyl-CoA thioester hydrolase
MRDMASSVESRVRVRYAETDQMGIVYHSNYLVWMEIGRVDFCRAKGILYSEMEAEGILLVVAEVNCRYSSPAVFDEEVTILTHIADVNPRMVRFEYEILHTDGKTVATGFTKHVYCSRERRPMKLPEKYWPPFGIIDPAQS